MYTFYVKNMSFIELRDYQEKNKSVMVMVMVYCFI